MDKIIRDYRASDNAGLAVMWNESQQAWPTGFGGTTGYDEERIANETKRRQALFHLVSECEGKITGYCWVSIYSEEPDACYVALLNVHPDFHGQGLGKRMILESVRRAVGLGYFRLDLNTWPSNIKAVPMYKKTGFFWQPGTSVHMQNYIPGIIRHPACAGFFSDHDWYDTFKRSYDQEPDEIKQGLRNVFPYRFEAGEKFVEVVIDTESRRIMKIATEAFSAGLRLDDPEVIAGRRNTICFEFNGGGTAGHTLRWIEPERPGVCAGPGGHNDGQFEVDASAVIPEDEEPAIVIGAGIGHRGMEFPLGAGVRPRQPVEIEWLPRYVAATPGKTTGIDFKLRNNLPEQATVTVTGSRTADARLELPYQRIVIPAGSSSGSSGRVLVDRPGVSELTVTASVATDSECLSTKKYIVPVLALGPGQRTLLWQDHKRAIWETPGLRLVIRKKGGMISVYQRCLGKRVVTLESSYGPPFDPTELSSLEYTVEQTVDETLVISVASQQNPGLVLVKEIGLSSESVLKIRHRLVNGTAAAVNYQLSQTIWASLDGTPRRRVIPLPGGLVEISGMHPFGHMGEELPKSPDQYLEPWWAWESPDTLVGLIWPGAMEIKYPALTYDFGWIDQGQAAETAPCYLMVGQGNYETVRRWYQQNILGTNPMNHIPVPVQQRIEANWESPVMFLPAGEPAKRNLTVTNHSKSIVTAEAAIDVCPQVSAEPALIAWDGIGMGKDGSVLVNLCAAGDEAGIGKIRLRVGTSHRSTEFGVIPIRAAGKSVGITQSQDRGLESWTIDNGSSIFKVSPDFLGTLYSWKHQGTEQLLSSFPEPGNFSWERPWYGGLYPMISDPKQWGINLLTKEKITAGPVEHTGKTGLVWRGVRVASRLTERTIRGLLLEIDYLTLPGCDLLATVLRMTNLTSAFFVQEVELTGFLCPGGSNARTKLLWDSAAGCGEISRGDTGAWATTKTWASAQNPETGAVITLSLPDDGTDQELLLWDYGRDGGHLCQNIKVALNSRQSKEFFAFWSLAGDAVKAKPFQMLSRMKILP